MTVQDYDDGPFTGDVDTPRDTHYEIALDDEPDTRAPVYVDVVTKDDTRQPIIPAQWRGKENIKATIKHRAGGAAHRVGYHAPRFFLRYLPFALFWSIIGAGRLIGRQIRWWWVVEQSVARQLAASTGDGEEWRKLHREVKSTRLYRGLVLAGELAALVVAASALWLVAPWWAVVFAAAVIVPTLAHVGRPQTMPIVTPAVVAPRWRRLNPDIVLRAYYAAKLGDPAKHPIKFGGRMSRDAKDLGSQVLVDLDYGFTTAGVIKAKAELASGLDVSSNQVFITKDRSSDRRHMLYVADRDPLAIPAGRTPLLRLKPTDIWRPAPFGLDERGNLVTLMLLWISVLVGAQPRKGKTFSARLLALYAACDPYVRIILADGKNSPDWNAFRLIAHMAIFGTVPNSRDRDPVEHLLTALRYLKKHIESVNEFLSKLPVTECPEGKLTRELSRKYAQLRVHLLVMEEFQLYYELDDKDASEEIASLLSFIMAVGPSAGVIILSSSQKPSGVGAGQNIQRLFTRYRDNHAVRFALKCGSRDVSIAVLGGDAYGEGFDASTLPVSDGDEYKGVGILYGASDNTPIVRTYLANAKDAEKILRAARAFREAQDLLTGEAAGEDMAREARDVLNDVIGVFYAGKATISWPALAARLAEVHPEAYADITPAAISAMVRKHGVPGKTVHDPEHFDSGKGQGCDKAAINAAIDRRSIESR